MSSSSPSSPKLDSSPSVTKRGSPQYSTNKSRVYALQPNGDQLLPNGNIINWNRGILNQLWKLDGCYIEWIEHAKLKQIRMFDSDFLEGGSFTFWWVVPSLYIPWSLLELYTGLRYFNGTHPYFINDNININNVNYAWNPLNELFYLPNIVSCFVYFLFGLLIWSLFEYVCHRFLFHWTPSNRRENYIHFLGHGLHHLTPTDDLRLVFPPAISLTLSIIVFLFFKSIFAIGISNCLLAGFGFGYASYESTHYLSHHYGHLLELPNDKNNKLNKILLKYLPFISYIKDTLFNYFNNIMKWYLKQRFKYHSAHHFNDSKKDKLFGVTSQIWDVVFGTF